MLWLGMTRCLLRAAYVYVRLLGSNFKREREREREREDGGFERGHKKSRETVSK